MINNEFKIIAPDGDTVITTTTADSIDCSKYTSNLIINHHIPQDKVYIPQDKAKKKRSK